MNNTEYKLFQEISKISNSNNWEGIKKEWKLSCVYESDEYQTCMCGHYPIKEICVLMNLENKKEAEVGNSCVNKFLGIESDPIMKGIKKIKESIYNSVPEKLIIKSHKENIINNWECEFYMNIRLKRKLSLKQKETKGKINNKILYKYLKNN